MANRDARRVFEARAEGLRKAREADDQPLLARLLAESIAMQLWRGKSLTGFDAMTENLLGIDPVQARMDAEAAAAEHKQPLDLSEEAIAVWVRTDAGLLTSGIPNGRSRIVQGETSFELEVLVPAESASLALVAVGRSHHELALDADPTGGREAPRRDSRGGDGRGDDRRRDSRHDSRHERPRQDRPRQDRPRHEGPRGPGGKPPPRGNR